MPAFSGCGRTGWRAPQPSRWLVVAGWRVRVDWSWPYGGVGVGGGNAGEQAQAFFGVAAGLGVSTRLTSSSSPVVPRR